MSPRIAFLVCILLSSISFAQVGFTSGPVFTYQLNGIDTEGTIHRSDSILTLTCSDGKTYSILNIEMSCSERSIRIPGNILSKEMRVFVKNSKIGEKIFLLLRLSASRESAILAVTAMFLVE